MAKRIVILGGGESGAGAAVLAKKQGFDTFVSDMSAIKDKYKSMLDERGIAWEEGKHTEELILNADEIIKSPGIPNEAPIVQKLIAQGTPIISEIEFASPLVKEKVDLPFRIIYIHDGLVLCDHFIHFDALCKYIIVAVNVKLCC